MNVKYLHLFGVQPKLSQQYVNILIDGPSKEVPNKGFEVWIDTLGDYD